MGGVFAIAAAVKAVKQTGGVTLLSWDSQKMIIWADNSAFDMVQFTEKESKEVTRLLNFRGGSDFNLSESEIAVFRKLSKELRGQSELAKREAVSSAYGDILRKRYHAYRQQGLNGIDPYRRKRGTSSPAEELSLVANSMPVATTVFTEFQRSLLDYPEAGGDYAHYFFLVKTVQQGRPAFMLTHRTVNKQPGYALLAEQQFYVGHTYNSSHSAMGWFPHDDKTLVGLITRTSTEKVAGASFARNLGRKHVQKIVAPFFAELRIVLHGG